MLESADLWQAALISTPIFSCSGNSVKNFARIEIKIRLIIDTIVVVSCIYLPSYLSIYDGGIYLYILKKILFDHDIRLLKTSSIQTVTRITTRIKLSVACSNVNISSKFHQNLSSIALVVLFKKQTNKPMSLKTYPPWWR